MVLGRISDHKILPQKFSPTSRQSEKADKENDDDNELTWNYMTNVRVFRCTKGNNSTSAIPHWCQTSLNEVRLNKAYKFIFY